MMGRKHSIPPISDEEEARIQRQIAADPDAPEATDEELAQAKPFAKAFPEFMASIERARERSKAEAQVSILLDPDVAAKFKAAGPDWRKRVNEVLRAAKL